jgi:hypothetical protein
MRCAICQKTAIVLLSRAYRCTYAQLGKFRFVARERIYQCANGFYLSSIARIIIP